MIILASVQTYVRRCGVAEHFWIADNFTNDGNCVGCHVIIFVIQDGENDVYLYHSQAFIKYHHPFMHVVQLLSFIHTYIYIYNKQQQQEQQAQWNYGI